jgi:hypothetical protein
MPRPRCHLWICQRAQGPTVVHSTKIDTEGYCSDLSDSGSTNFCSLRWHGDRFRHAPHDLMMSPARVGEVLCDAELSADQSILFQCAGEQE